jgi:FlaA1/EpsC-like NDP-sugar epimerase
MGWRLCYERFFLEEKFKHPLIERAGIIGAGDVGAGLLRELMARPALRLRPVLFIDDDRYKWGSGGCRKFPRRTPVAIS